MSKVDRHKTAVARVDFSRPVRLALDAGILSPDCTVLDYGCGRGDDVRGLKARGISATGWDPVHSPETALTEADVVNLGYVLNVIEDQFERQDVLLNAWRLTKKALLVSVRLAHEARGMKLKPLGDGFVTQRGTFQRFYTQQEARQWLDTTLGVSSVPAAPGIFYVFRDAHVRQSFIASTYRRALQAPSVRQSDILYEKHQDLLNSLSEFVIHRGRLPGEDELTCTLEITKAFGSLKRAFAVLRRATSTMEWEEISKERSRELLIYLALDRFGGRPKFSELPRALVLDVKAFFGSYTRACREADALLFTAGDMSKVDRACRDASVGKLTHDALYVHVSALTRLPPVLRVYEGCARAYVGAAEEANIVKLHRQKPKVSYLSYPMFDSKAHPALVGALVVPLRDFDVKYWDWQDSDNPPILHRKEELVSEDYPGRAKFSRLTTQEEKAGLYEAPSKIGRKREWEEELAQKGVRIIGHRVTKIVKEDGL